MSATPAPADRPAAAAPRTLADLAVGDRGKVAGLDGTSTLVQRLLEMGLTTGVEVLIVRFAPLGDPIEVKVRGYLLTLRRADARSVWIAN